MVRSDQTRGMGARVPLCRCKLFNKSRKNHVREPARFDTIATRKARLRLQHVMPSCKLDDADGLDVHPLEDGSPLTVIINSGLDVGIKGRFVQT